jgi:hypothetical protein
MNSTIPRVLEMDTLADALRRVERRLAIALALLMLGIVGILGFTLSQPAVQYVLGSTTPIAAVVDGAGCGAHLEWDMGRGEIEAGSRVEISNDTVYWRIPVVIEREDSDGTFRKVAESPPLQDGESWKYTFWRGGEYRIISADETQRLAGLETAVTVK